MNGYLCSSLWIVDGIGGNPPFSTVWKARFGSKMIDMETINVDNGTIAPLASWRSKVRLQTAWEDSLATGRKG